MILIEVWSDRSKVYDNLNWTKEQQLMNAMLKECDITNGSKLCDLGTGTGALANFFSPFCKNIIAVDKSEDMLKIAEQKNHKDNISYNLMDAENLSFNNNTFDRVISRMCFHHISDPTKAMNECYRILKDNGKIVICEVIPPYGAFNFYVDMLKCKEKRHVFTCDDLLHLLLKSDFTDINFIFYKMKQVSVRNWLNNSSLPSNIQDAIFDIWYNSPDYIKKTHSYKEVNGDILIDWLFMIASGMKINNGGSK